MGTAARASTAVRGPRGAARAGDAHIVPHQIPDVMGAAQARPDPVHDTPGNESPGSSLCAAPNKFDPHPFILVLCVVCAARHEPAGLRAVDQGPRLEPQSQSVPRPWSDLSCCCLY